MSPRSLLLASLLPVLPACATGVGDPPERQPASMRERLDATTQLQVVGGASVGQVRVERRMASGWEPSLASLGIENGEMLVSSQRRDQLTIEGIQVSFAPIELPAGVFGDADARLINVQLELAEPTTVTAAWTGDDQVTLAADLQLALAWQLQLDSGAPTSLGAPELPAIPVELTLTGDGARVDAEIGVRVVGEVWSWAGLVRLSDFALDARAALDRGP